MSIKIVLSACAKQIALQVQNALLQVTSENKIAERLSKQAACNKNLGFCERCTEDSLYSGRSRSLFSLADESFPTRKAEN